MGKKSNKGIIIYAVVMISALALMVFLFRQASKPQAEHSYSDIMQYFDNYQVSEMTFDLGTGELVIIVDDSEAPISYTTLFRSVPWADAGRSFGAPCPLVWRLGAGCETIGCVNQIAFRRGRF